MSTLVPQTFVEGIAHNAEVAAKSGSTYVVVIFGALAALFAGLNPQQQAALLSSFPFLDGYVPIIAAVVAFLVTKLKPSSAVSSQTQALIDEILRLKTNPILVGAGLPTIPSPPTIPVPAASISPTPGGVTAMNTPFSAAPRVIDIPLPLGTTESQPIHIMIHQSL